MASTLKMFATMIPASKRRAHLSVILALPFSRRKLASLSVVLKGLFGLVPV